MSKRPYEIVDGNAAFQFALRRHADTRRFSHDVAKTALSVVGFDKVLQVLRSAPMLLPDKLSAAALADEELQAYFRKLHDWLPFAAATAQQAGATLPIDPADDPTRAITDSIAEMHRVADELGQRGLIDLSDDLRLQAGALVRAFGGKSRGAR